MNQRRVAKRTVILAGVAVLTLTVVVAAAVGQRAVALAALGALAGAGVLLAVDVAFRIRDLALAARRHTNALQRQTDALQRQSDALQRLTDRTASEQKLLGRVSSATTRQSDLLVEARRGLLGAFESERLRAADRHTELEQRVAAAGRDVRHAVCRDVEALIHLAPRLAEGRLMPPSGNWALDPRSLAHLIDIVEAERPRTVVELGSGTSTVWLSRLLAGTGARIVSIDHDEHYAGLTRAELARHDLAGAADIRVAPLKPLDVQGLSSTWYDLALLADLESIDLLLVDGPPKATGSLARLPAVPVVWNRLAKDALVLLDDADRPDEVEGLRRWLEEFPELVREQEGVSRLAVLRRTP